ncbi:DUF3833 domain-containing protein [Marinospirillum perlucidum]|uniref:DUF3833 domain-containing protein n=1 Tax=Marinospirillum perlucidum TaxID=1982602 RepID=UPI000DF1FA78|nr:DUF3833 domain-containing protein [Marinospirillum perlucidum]
MKSKCNFSVIAFLSLMLLLSGCGSAKLQDYAKETPQLRIEDFFVGETWGWGQVQDYTGRVTRQFQVKIQGHLEGETLILDEDFIYHDGRQDQRRWTFEPLNENCYVGRAMDVRGQAEACQAGNVFHMEYRLEVEIDEAIWVFTMDDWMYLQEDGLVINRTQMNKWGLTLGEITLFLSKQPFQAR